MPNHITSIRYFSCGYCINNLKLVFKNWPKEKRKFPAGVYLISHKKHGQILFDTGYSTDIYHAGLIGKAYCLFNPTTVTTDNIIKNQLKSSSIDATQIKTIILSHLHPDHIGSLKDFPQANFILSQEAIKSYHSPKLRNLIIKSFFPSDFEQRTTIITDNQMNAKILNKIQGYDYFGDGSLILLKLNGHASGQLCALVNHKVLLAADSCWGNDLLKASHHIKFPATLIQDDIKAYRDTLNTLTELKNSGIRLIFSHDTNTPKELL